MAKVIFFVVLFAAMYISWRMMRVKQIKLEKELEKERTQKASSQAIGSRKVVQCAHCGVYVDQAEALEKDGQYFCSPQHLRAGAKQSEN